jgi:glutaconate CoA-transferase subunit B
MPQSRRAFVERLDFLTSTGHGEGGDHRARLGMTAIGPARVITDLCVMEPDAATRELTVMSLHPGVTRDQVVAATAWQIRFAAAVSETLAPSGEELAVLRQLRLETENTHKEQEHA